MSSNNGDIIINHKALGNFTLYSDNKTELLFCDNETNNKKLYDSENASHYCKDGINEFLVNGNEAALI